MVRQASLHSPFCRPPNPSVHATTGDGEGEQGGVGGREGIRLGHIMAHPSWAQGARDEVLAKAESDLTRCRALP